MDVTKLKIKDISSIFFKEKIICFICFVSIFITFVVKFLFAPDYSSYQLMDYFGQLLTGIYITFIFWLSYKYVMCFIGGESHPTKKIIGEVTVFVKSGNYFYDVVFRFLVLNLIISNYTYFKKIIPQIIPFSYDEFFYEIDRFLHFGIDPWKITHFLFPNEYFTLFITSLYYLWFVILWLWFVFYVFYSGSERKRNQFIISFVLTWFLLGNIVATFLSSAGPCFFHYVSSNTEAYFGLFSKLEAQSLSLESQWGINLWFLNVQDTLWQQHINDGNMLGAGISAMPSMHVSLSVVMALGASQLNRYMGYVMWTYALLIQVGSVHIGWHYAIDGYLSIILTVFIWSLVKYILNCRKDRGVVTI
ncbi:phosphatase PAP2 family protein [Vibrio maerlii]|uniref:phosphatase PAP2 family protein n=1 Tax=Vibrio maerlii TaxID=2231648 RepID=UPI000E3BBC52|nr:phosphatase PAP2 family protein [Vibrio maerlii]